MTPAPRSACIAYATLLPEPMPPTRPMTSMRRFWQPAGARASDARACASGRQAFEHAREGDGLAHVVQTAEPRDHALDAHAEAGVRYRAVATQIEVPGERGLGQTVLGDLALQGREIVLALSDAEDLAVNFCCL